MAKSMRELFVTKQFELYGTGAPRIIAQGNVADVRELISIGFDAIGAESIANFIRPEDARRSPSAIAQKTSSGVNKTTIGVSPDGKFNTFKDKALDIVLGEEPWQANKDKLLADSVTLLKHEAQNFIFKKLRNSGIARPDIRAQDAPRGLETWKSLGIFDTRWTRTQGNQLYEDILSEATQRGDPDAGVDGSIDSPLTTTEYSKYTGLNPYITYDVASKIRRTNYSKYTEFKGDTPLGTENLSTNNLLGVRRGIYTQADAINQIPIIGDDALKAAKHNYTPLDDLDLVPFKFKDITNSKSLLFRCTIRSFNEQFNPDWKSAKHVGRPFNYYYYDGLERQASVSFTLFALNAIELKFMWNKLNYLVGMTYPVGYKDEYMQPPFIRVTLGNIFKENAVIINSLNYSIPDDATWEIGGKTRVKTNSDIGFDNLDKDKQLKSPLHPDDDRKGVDISIKKRFPMNPTYTKSDPSTPGKWIVTDKEWQNNRLKTGGSSRFDEGRIIPGQYNTSDSEVVNYDIDNYKLPKIIEVDMTMTVLQSGFPAIHSQHFGFKPINWDN